MIMELYFIDKTLVHSTIFLECGYGTNLTVCIFWFRKQQACDM